LIFEKAPEAIIHGRAIREVVVEELVVAVRRATSPW